MKPSLWVGAFALGMTVTASAQESPFVETVVVIEHADGPSPTVTEIPYQPPAPATESALALDAPVVLVLPPGSRVHVLDAELTQPVPEPPRVTAPHVAPPQIPSPQVASTALELQARIDHLRRKRPGLGFPISLIAGGAVSLGFSTIGLSSANLDCSFGDDCGRVARMRGLVGASAATLAFGIVRLVMTIVRRHRMGREIRLLRRQLEAITHGPSVSW